MCFKFFMSFAVNLLLLALLFLIGLYHKYGRVFTDIRRFIFRMTNNRLRFLDTRLNDTKLNIARKEAWFKDQYKNPHESKHTISEILEWFKKSDERVEKRHEEVIELLKKGFGK